MYSVFDKYSKQFRTALKKYIHANFHLLTSHNFSTAKIWSSLIDPKNLAVSKTTTSMK